MINGPHETSLCRQATREGVVRSFDLEAVTAGVLPLIRRRCSIDGYSDRDHVCVHETEYP